MEIGGAERSFIGLAEALSSEKAEINLFLYQQKGEFLKDLPTQVKLLPEIPTYRAYTEPILTLLKHGKIHLAATRLLAKLAVRLYGVFSKEPVGTWTYMQYISKFLQPFLPRIPGEYNLAVQYLGVADTLVNKVTAESKAAWNHTDYTAQHANYKLDTFVYERVNFIVSVSENCTEVFKKIYPRFSRKAVTIENCLARDLIERRSLLPANGMHREAGETILLSVGRFCEAKNFEAIPKICIALLKQGLSVRWYILGYGDREKQLRDAVQDMHMEDFVIFLGKKENPYPYMRLCDIYVQPSLYEGKCVAVREAQLLGKPVVIADFPTAHSQLKNNTNGIIAPKDPQRFAAVLAGLIRDKTKQEKLKAACLCTDHTLRGEAKKVLKLTERREEHAENQHYRTDLQCRKVSRAMR